MVEMEARKLQSDREQFEMQRHFENMNKPVPEMNNFVNPAFHLLQQHQHPQFWNQMSPPKPPNVLNMPAGYPLHHQQAAQMYPSKTPPPYAYHPSSLPSARRASASPYYPYQQLQPPYAVQDQEMYHNYETTHKQEYNYETLHASHHNYYQQQPPPSVVYPKSVANSSQDQFVSPPANGNTADAERLLDNQNIYSNDINDQTKATVPHQDLGTSDVDPNMTRKDSMGPQKVGSKVSRPQSLPVQHMAASTPRQQSRSKDTFDESEAASVISPIDPDVEVSSSVEVTPENSPVRSKPVMKSLSSKSMEPSKEISGFSDRSTSNTSQFGSPSDEYQISS